MQITWRNVLAFQVASFLVLTGLQRKFIKRVLNENIILSIYCHNPERDFFESCIRWLQKMGFSFIGVNDIAAIAKGEKTFPKGAVVLTVDDGWRNNKENIASIANKYKVPVTIFASTEPIATGNAYWWSYISQAKNLGLTSYSVETLKRTNNDQRLEIVEAVKAKLDLKREALTVAELVEISKTDFITIGSHTVTHPILTKCSSEKSGYEISESRKILEEWLNKNITYFAYPNGAFSNREIDLLKNAGYQAAFTTQPKYITPENIHELYALPRVDLLENVSFMENICRMTGLWFKKWEILKFNSN